LLLTIVQKKLPVPTDILLAAYPELQPGSMAEARERQDAPRKNASTFAVDNLKRVMAETNSRIKEIDARLRDIEAERESLYQAREREFHRQILSHRIVGDLGK
jgi:Skp family chaperone for outer membrane proteins